jgi:tetratricopeptide (TPR) repeat protein
MSDQKQQKLTPDLRALCVIVMGAFLIAGCNATTKPQRPVANIQIQEAVGFTITEEVKISESVRLEYYEALNYLRDGQLERGIDILETVAEAAPLVTAPRIDLVLKALELNANHPVAHNELGIIYRKTGRFKEAKQRYEAAIAVYPGYHHARRNLAILCDLYLGDLDCALHQYEAYMATVPADEEASMWIADLRNRMAAR